jgi:serine/threonine protein kinase
VTTRDPHKGPGRDPSQSLNVDSEDAAAEHPSLALGTHGDENTRIESPGGRGRTPPPPRAPSMPPTPTAEDPEGRVGTSVGSYRVQELLGKGGMGYVYRAEHVKLGREVALKLLRSDYAKRKDAVARFIQEARTVNRIRHRNIVDVPDIVEMEDGTTCIVMELLIGTSLGKWARSGIELPRALAVLVQICDGLAAAHSVDIVHRDLKPDNVFVVPTNDGAELVKLLDFGVAKLLNRDDEDVGFQTAAGSVIGTPAYMSPEQAGGMLVDARSDIYSLGAIMYELFCGMPMFRGRSFGEYVRKHLTEMPVPPRQTTHGQHIDERLEAVILRALAKDPNERYQHIVEVRDDLLHLLGGIETMPPAFGNLTMSGIRPPPTMGPHSLPTRLPQQQLLPHTNPTMNLHPSAFVQQSSIVHPSHAQLHHASQPYLPAPRKSRALLVGGGIAVGLGIAAAIWFSRTPDLAVPKPVDTKPVVPKIDPKPEVAVVPALPASITLKFDSLPSGGVYVDGQSAERCTTPCSFDVAAPAAGAPTTQGFVIKAPNYKDATLEVDLANVQPQYTIRLEQNVPDKLEVSTAPDKSTAGLSKKGKVTKHTGKEGTKEPETAPVDPVKQSDEQKPTKKTGGKIDRSDTLDPFSE